MDHLLSMLLNDVLPYYALKQRRQHLGFEGINIEVKKRQDIIKKSKEYSISTVLATSPLRAPFFFSEPFTKIFA
jgi:acyl-[acyl carrier protein]--UDP-N-acetylglucosamine O-acyltransferase